MRRGFLPGFLVLTGVLVFSQFAAPLYAEDYSLQDLYGAALERAERVKFTEEDLAIAKEQKEKARSAIIPDITAYAAYTRYSESKMSAAGPVIQPESSSAYGLRLDQFYSLSGNEFRDIRIADKDIERTSYDISAFKEDYIFSVAGAYYDVLKSSKLVDIARANMERLSRQRDAAEARLKVGEVTKTALLRAEAELSGARSDLVRAENALALSRAVLARVVGIEGDFGLKETDHAEDGITGYTLPSLKEIALSERPELKSLALRREIAGERIRTAHGQYWPFLALEGVYEKRESNPSPFFFNDESISGGVSMNFVVFEGGLRKSQVNEAKSREKQASLLYDDFRREVSVEVENAHLDYLTQKGVFDALKDQLVFARDNFNAVSKQFTFGLADSLDVMDANTLLVTAERQVAEAGYDYHVAILRLRRATGTLLGAVTGAKSTPEENK